MTTILGWISSAFGGYAGEGFGIKYKNIISNIIILNYILEECYSEIIKSI
jgi:hypothetical protein